MKIFCCQLDSVWENKAANFAKARKLLGGASIPPGSLVLLPEMFATGFSMNIAAVAEGAPSETADFLADAAREFGIYLMGGLVTAAPGDKAKGRNQAVVFSPEGKELVRYTDVFRGYCFLILIYGLIQWYATVLKNQGSENPLSEALSMVERYYVLHSDFNQLFLYHPALADIMDYIFKKSNFAHSIIMG